MKRGSVVVVSLLVVGLAAVGFRTVDACGDWQERYERFLYIQIMQNSPMVYSPAMIDEIVGGRPFGCDRPETNSLSQRDIDRFHSAPVDPNEFLDETRAAYKRTDGFRNF